MAFLFSNLGLPAQVAAGAPSGSTPAGSAAGAKPARHAHASFGSLLNGKLDAMGGQDPLAQLTALVQNGTPMSTVVDALANRIADAAAKQLPAAGLTQGQSRSQFVGALVNALSPPSNAPPGSTAAESVAALARRLGQWVSNVAGAADRQAGQQVESTGTVLDATTARELPAQHDPQALPAGGTLDASALAQSLLASIAAQLSGASSLPSTGSTSAPAAPGTFKTPSETTGALARLHELAEHLGNDVVSQLSGSPATATLASGAAPNDPTASASQAPLASTPAPAAADAAASSEPADVLARMLARAANVDARINGGTPPSPSAASSAAEAPSTPLAASTSVTPQVTPDAQQTSGMQLVTPGSTASIRLVTLLANAITAAAQTGTGSGDPRSSTLLARDQSASTDASAKALNALVTSAAPAAPAPTASLAQPQAAAALPAPVDPTDLVEQMVKGMVMRTGTDGTSTVRLRLVPESLGEVSMKLTVDGSSVSATAVAQNADVRSALLAHQQQLARSLGEAGLKLTSFTVDLSGNNAGNDRGSRDQTSGFGRRYTVHEIAGADADSGDSSDGGPPLLARSSLALLDYLA